MTQTNQKIVDMLTQFIPAYWEIMFPEKPQTVIQIELITGTTPEDLVEEINGFLATCAKARLVDLSLKDLTAVVEYAAYATNENEPDQGDSFVNFVAGIKPAPTEEKDPATGSKNILIGNIDGRWHTLHHVDGALSIDDAISAYEANVNIPKHTSAIAGYRLLDASHQLIGEKETSQA